MACGFLPSCLRSVQLHVDPNCAMRLISAARSMFAASLLLPIFRLAVGSEIDQAFSPAHRLLKRDDSEQCLAKLRMDQMAVRSATITETYSGLVAGLCFYVNWHPNDDPMATGSALIYEMQSTARMLSPVFDGQVSIACPLYYLR